MIFLTRKNPETQKRNAPVGKGAYYYYQTHKGKKNNLRISRESNFDSPRNQLAAMLGEGSRKVILLLKVLT